MTKPTFKDIWEKPDIAIATWFGCGLAPKATGTAGSLGALPVAFLMHYFLGQFALLAAAAIMFGIGWWASERYLKQYPDDPDPSPIVVDEVAGQMLLLSVLFPTWQSYVIGFLLFRLFDVLKPWPVNWADRKLKAGLGVMADDMLAGGYPIFIMLIFAFAVDALGGTEIVRAVYTFLGGGFV